MSEGDSDRLEGVAAGSLDRSDALLLSRTRHLYETFDPVPSGLVERISFAIALEHLDVEVAVLQDMGGALAMSRGSDPAELRSLTFQSETVTTVVTISSSGFDKRRLEGWVVPGADARVKLNDQSSEREVLTDDDGHFVFDDVLPGKVTLQVWRGEGPAHRRIVIPEFDV